MEALNAKGIPTHTRMAGHYSCNILIPRELTDCVRIPFCHYNTEDEVATLLAGLEDMAAGLKGTPALQQLATGVLDDYKKPCVVAGRAVRCRAGRPVQGGQTPGLAPVRRGPVPCSVICAWPRIMQRAGPRIAQGPM